MNCAAESALPQGDSNVHTGEPGTNQQNAVIVADVVQSADYPGVRDITLAVRRFTRQPRISRRKITERQHHFVRKQELTAAKVDLRLVAAARERDGFILPVLELARTKFHFLLEHVGYILTVHRPRQEMRLG